MNDVPIAVERLTRYFGSRAAVRDLCFEVPRGSVLALVGRNGSGKTTTLRMLLGLLQATRGRARLLGCDSSALTVNVRARVGYLPENHPLYPWMTAKFAEELQAKTYPHWRKAVFRSMLERFRITEHTRVKELSRGERAALYLALTLGTDPEVLVLDDPALGLDPVARRALLEALLSFTREEGKTILFTSHLLPDIERLADRLAILDRGVLRAWCSVETLLAQIREYALHFEKAPPKAPQIPGLVGARTTATALHVTVVHPRPEHLEQFRGLGAVDVEEIPLNLEQALIAYLGDRGEQPELFTPRGSVS